ncbi:hypothetical protein V0M98_36245 (plasmid) [Pseudomonas silesiensis]|uniref:hypothetical protein n=1 Tax=Pseudomonas silesiensis TaxID=1853130 RepID=UPI0030CF3F73
MPDTQLSNAEEQRLENESRFGTGPIADDRALLSAIIMMNEDELAEFSEWKEEHVATGEYATIDWPGWESVINRING